MIALGNDHTGLALKKEIINLLEEKGLEYRDFGTYTSESCDYPVFGEAVGRAVASGMCEKGIVICGTGIGISIAANKVRGVRCALCSDCYSAEMSRKHNDANVLALGARTLGVGSALKIVETWLETDFDGGRHMKRIQLFTDIENR